MPAQLRICSFAIYRCHFFCVYIKHVFKAFACVVLCQISPQGDRIGFTSRIWATRVPCYPQRLHQVLIWASSIYLSYWPKVLISTPNSKKNSKIRSCQTLVVYKICSLKNTGCWLVSIKIQPLECVVDCQNTPTIKSTRQKLRDIIYCL